MGGQCWAGPRGVESETVKKKGSWGKTSGFVHKGLWCQ